MTFGPPYLSCRWGPRRESAEICAERLAKMLTGLARIHPAFAHWNEQGATKKEAYLPFCSMPPRVDELTRVLENNFFEPDVEKCGYAVHPWNGSDQPYDVAMRVLVGNALKSPLFPNSIGLHLPPPMPANADFINTSVMKAALLAIAMAWNPDWGGISPWGYWERWGRKEPWPGEPAHAMDKPYFPAVRAGWMTYLCADYAHRITRPPGIEAEPVITGGCLLTTTEDTFSEDNPAHNAAADAIQEALLPVNHLPYEAIK